MSEDGYDSFITLQDIRTDSHLNPSGPGVDMIRPGDTSTCWLGDLRSCRSRLGLCQQTNLDIIHESDVVRDIDTVSLRNLHGLGYSPPLPARVGSPRY